MEREGVPGGKEVSGHTDAVLTLVGGSVIGAVSLSARCRPEGGVSVPSRREGEMAMNRPRAFGPLCRSEDRRSQRFPRFRVGGVPAVARREGEGRSRACVLREWLELRRPPLARCAGLKTGVPSRPRASPRSASGGFATGCYGCDGDFRAKKRRGRAGSLMSASRWRRGDTRIRSEAKLVAASSQRRRPR